MELETDPQGCPRASARSERREVIARHCCPHVAPDTRRAQKKSRASKASLRDFTKGSRRSKRSSDDIGVVAAREAAPSSCEANCKHRGGERSAQQEVGSCAQEDAQGGDGEANEDSGVIRQQRGGEQFEMEETLTRSELAEAPSEAVATNRRGVAVSA